MNKIRVINSYIRIMKFEEASFMMMNQVDSSSFDDDKNDDKKPKRMISRLSQQVQDQV